MRLEKFPENELAMLEALMAEYSRSKRKSHFVDAIQGLVKIQDSFDILSAII